MHAAIVTTDEELQQIVELSHLNQRGNVTEEEKSKEGFISWEYSYELLKQMQDQCPHIIVKDGEKLAGYALVALKEAKAFHVDLAAMISKLEILVYNGKALAEYNYYVMGQVCIDRAYRGKGVFDMLYQHHKQILKGRFDFVVTEISTNNPRSIRAHERIGFKNIYTYRDAVDEWSLVLWDWE